jgi:hypothetical protein
VRGNAGGETSVSFPTFVIGNPSSKDVKHKKCGVKKKRDGSPLTTGGDTSGEDIRGEASGATMGRQKSRMDERSQISEVTNDPGHPEYNEGSG